MPPPKIVAVVGATGAQGSSVVDALLRDPAYTVRAISRNPNGESAKGLAAKGVQLVQADSNDVESLKSAFEGCYAVFAVTNFYEPFKHFGFDATKAMEVEMRHGVNLARAAAATPTLQHYVWSTLPSASKISEGRYRVPHFEAKSEVDTFIKSQPELRAKTTFLWVGFYATNLDSPTFTPYHIPTAQKYIQIQSTPADTPMHCIGDVQADLGRIVVAALGQPDRARGRYVLAYSELATTGQLLQAWADGQGTQVQYVQVDRDTYNAIWPGWAQEIGSMMEFWAWARERSWSGEGSILTPQDLGVTDMVGIKEAVAHLSY